MRLSRRERHQVRTAKVNGSDTPGRRVLIFDHAHPHCGATGYTVPDDVIRPRDGGPPMVRVNLDPGAGTTHCYVESAQLMPCTHSYRGASNAT